MDIESEILERLARMELDLRQMRDGLALAGVRRCENCKKFYRSSDAALLFDDGAETVCYVCIHEWWPRRGGELELKDRETIEHKLVRWLVAHHNAQLIQRSHKLPAEPMQEFKLVAGCDQCEGTGTLLGGHCRYCGGEGKLWVVIPKNIEQ
jgi:hypothetical protein